MKDRVVEIILDHFKKHRTQGRIFLATFGITTGISFGLYAATALYNTLLDILNSCI